MNNNSMNSNYRNTNDPYNTQLANKQKKNFENRKNDEIELDRLKRHLEQKRREYIKENDIKDAKEEAKQQLANLNFLIAYKKKLEEAGLKSTQAQQEKALKLLDKQERILKTNTLKEIYSAESSLSKRLKETRRSLNESILESPDASKQEKRQARLEIMQDNFAKGLNNAVNNLINRLDELNTTMERYAEYQANINARTQGAGLGSTYYALESRISDAIGVNPYFQTQKVMDNLASMVDQGIVFNVEQRAFLQTISDNIARTFDAANGTLLRLIKIQQADSTAARLGMEAYMTQFLNKLFKNTEYLGSSGGGGLADSVSSALFEATSQLGVQAGFQFEYAVQKWLGSLSSVGISDTAVNNLATAIGYLGSGNIAALTNDTAMQNLLAISAARANLDYAKILTEGLDIDTTNRLLQSVVEYLQEISNTTNNVVRSSYANIFGLSISDLQAARNLTSQDISNILRSNLTYASGIGELYRQMTMLPMRLSTGELVQNMLANAKYGLATNVAKSPVLQALWSITSLIESYTGGINIPTISVMGNMVDLNTTVENLMKLGIVGIGSLGMIGDVVSGLTSAYIPASMLTKLGITGKVQTVSRGGGFLSGLSGLTQSASAVISTAGGSQDIYSGTVQAAKTEAQQTFDEEKAKQDTLVKTVLVDDSGEQSNFIKNIQDTAISILNILQGAVAADGSFKVTSSFIDRTIGNDSSNKAYTMGG